jgi:hypothetical protein
MNEVTLEDLKAFLDEALSEAETARVERALRQSASLRQILRGLMTDRDRGEHSVGAIWRRERLSCPTREQMGCYLLGVLDEDFQDYVRFHLETVGCPYCQANLIDLQNQRKEPPAQVQQRRKKLYQSSAGYLQVARERR